MNLGVAVAVAVAVASADPVALAPGQAAPFGGVLVDDDRAEELIRAEAERDALRLRLKDEVEIREAWAKLAKSAAAPSTDGWLDDPELNRWLGFFVGVAVAAGAVIAGAWISGVADDAGGGDR